AHIAIDTVPNMLPPRARAAVDFFNQAIIVASSIMLIIHGGEYVMRAIAASPALQMPMRFYFLAVPVGGALNLFFLLWPRPERTLVDGLKILAAGAVLYLAIRYGAGYVYGESSSAWVLNIVGLVLIILGAPIA